VGDDQGRPLHPIDHVGDGEGLAGAGHAEEHLRPVTAPQTLDELLDRPWLIAGRLVLAFQVEGHRGYL
jgi:hypothetical protein